MAAVRTGPPASLPPRVALSDPELHKVTCGVEGKCARFTHFVEAALPQFGSAARKRTRELRRLVRRTQRRRP